MSSYIGVVFVFLCISGLVLIFVYFHMLTCSCKFYRAVDTYEECILLSFVTVIGAAVLVSWSTWPRKVEVTRSNEAARVCTTFNPKRQGLRYKKVEVTPLQTPSSSGQRLSPSRDVSCVLFDCFCLSR